MQLITPILLAISCVVALVLLKLLTWFRLMRSSLPIPEPLSCKQIQMYHSILFYIQSVCTSVHEKCAKPDLYHSSVVKENYTPKLLFVLYGKGWL